MKNSIYYFKQVLCYVLFLISFVPTYGQTRTSVTKLKEAITNFLQQENYLDNAEKIQMLAGPPIYQINAGGWETTGSWEEDSEAHPSPYLNPIPYNSANGINWYEFFTEKSRVSYNMEWNFPVDNGDYIVTLYFAEAENTTQTIGSRVFDVEIEGQKALDDFDIVKFTGKGFPFSFNFSVEVSDGNLDLDFMREYFTTSLISAIVIRPGVIESHDPILSQMTRGLETTVHEGTEYRIPIRATDFDSPSSAIKISGGDTGIPVDFVTVADHGDGNGEMIIKPDYDNAGDWQEAADSPVNWLEDSYGNPSPFLVHANFGAQTHFIPSNGTDAPDEVFHKSRLAWYSDMLWEFPIADGNYTVNLYFVESYFDNTGGRIFDVVIEGVKELDDFDILTETSKNVPLQKTFTTQVMDGSLNIKFERHSNKAHPIIAAIDIIYNGETAPSIMDNVHVDASEANDDLAQMVSVYPNPVEDWMTLTLPESVKGPVSIRLIDRNSQVKYQGTHNSDVVRNEAKFMIDANLPAGIYHAEVLANDSKHIIRIIKK